MTTVSQPVQRPRQGQLAQRARSTSTMALVGKISLFVVLLILSITWIFPLFWMVSSALKDDPQVYTVPPVLIPNPAYWRNFIDAWYRLDFNTAAINSVFRYALPVTLLTVVSSVIVAYGFAKIRWRGREALFWVCIATMMLPWQVTMVPLFIIFKHLGWINTYLPFVVPAFFGHPYFIFLLRQFFRTVPEELSEAARIEGASELGILFRILVPLSKPALAVVLLFRFLWAWNDYLGPLIYINQENMQPLALMIYRLRTIALSMGNTAMAYPHLMAVSTIVALPVILAFVFAQRTFIEGISTTGLKG
ncbi:carbohydrate ABC transporter permease [Litorilinea aerophila]|uniref:Carbohydrate ABC transporter permease n=1 Tax=Litorilinea aerophila TaxID=1204385 RepID=A0A540VLA2_9CHLR|nr:carbohydrate ABC transporter permease [Litorilinea aerophila]MCC9074759.1 carbohydrate ABC transporter permease [Litorilinea aerophila]GIV77919.1 MAG: sn-glycerol-3-phosphate transport system permease protein UgpE [Litorilinea sp.]